MRESTIFYRSFYEAIKELPAQNQAEIYTAIFEYSLNFQEIELHGISKTIFTLIRPLIDANIKRYKNGLEPKEKQEGSKTEAKPKQEGSKTEGNANVNDNDNVNPNVNENKNEDKKKKTKVFTPPSLQEVKSYFAEKGYSEQSAEKAFDFYHSANWHDSKGSAVRNWKQKMIGVWFKDENKEKQASNYAPKPHVLPTQSY